MKRFFYVALFATALAPAAFAAQSASTNAAIQTQNLSDENIRQIQQNLIDQGYLKGSVTGTWDANNTAALRRYQAKNHLSGNGSLNANTMSRLGITNYEGSTTTGSANSSSDNSNNTSSAYDGNGASRMSTTGSNSTNPSTPANDFGTRSTVNSSNSMNSTSPSAGSSSSGSAGASGSNGSVGASGSMGTTSGGGSSSGSSAGGGGASGGH